MSKTPTKLMHMPSVEDARQAFESAMAQIQQRAKSANPSKTPIAVRKQSTIPGDPATEKRALTDAARALALLWNVSPTLVR